MDVAIGAIGPGETWAAAAQGAYDARWRTSLTKLRAYSSIDFDGPGTGLGG